MTEISFPAAAWKADTYPDQHGKGWGLSGPRSLGRATKPLSRSSARPAGNPSLFLARTVTGPLHPAYQIPVFAITWSRIRRVLYSDRKVLHSLREVQPVTAFPGVSK